MNNGKRRNRLLSSSVVLSDGARSFMTDCCCVENRFFLLSQSLGPGITAPPDIIKGSQLRTFKQNHAWINERLSSYCTIKISMHYKPSKNLQLSALPADQNSYATVAQRSVQSTTLKTVACLFWGSESNFVLPI